MKVIYFKRMARSGFHVHAFYSSSCFYIPDEKVVVGEEQSGSFGGKSYFLSEKENILEEAKAIAEGKVTEIAGVNFSDIKEFDYDCSKLKGLVGDMRAKAGLEGKVKEGVAELLGQIK